MPPKVSVVIATYNTGPYICEAVESVLTQTYRDFEIIVIDDGSTDDTRERLSRFQQQIIYIYQENRERSAARNHGIRVAQGEYVAFLDADDYWLPDKLEKQISVLENDPDLAAVNCWMKPFYGDEMLPDIAGAAFDRRNIHNAFEELLLEKTMPLCAVMRKACLESVGAFDETISCIEDWDLWLRLTLQYRVDIVPEVLAYYRLGDKFLPAVWARREVQRTRVYAVRKVFEIAREIPSVHLTADLERKAMTQAYWRACLIDYAVDQIAAAQTHWECALEYDDNFFIAKTTPWIENLIGFANRLYDTVTPPEEAEAFVIRVFDHLPRSVASLHRLRRNALGRLKAGYAFQARRRGDLQGAGKLMRRAIMYYPLLLRNRGVISIALRGTWLDPARVAACSLVSAVKKRL